MARIVAGSSASGSRASVSRARGSSANGPLIAPVSKIGRAAPFLTARPPEYARRPSRGSADRRGLRRGTGGEAHSTGQDLGVSAHAEQRRRRLVPLPERADEEQPRQLRRAAVLAREPHVVRD